MTPFGPDPVPTPETQPYWDGAARGELMIMRCGACGQPYFYPRSFCPHCSSLDVQWERASGKARLLSFIINQRPLRPADPASTTVVVIVELAEGPRMTSVLVGVDPDPSGIALGADLRVAFQERGAVVLPVFELATAA